MYKKSNFIIRIGVYNDEDFYKTPLTFFLHGVIYKYGKRTNDR